MLGYNPKTSWAHICSGGTVANIEALWVARTVKFVPLMVYEFCQSKKINFEIKTPAGESVNLGNVNHKYSDKNMYKILINLKPNDSICMIRNVAKYLIDECGQNRKEVIHQLNTFIKKSQFNINRVGMREIHNKINMTPRIFISESAHYCIKKAANILGYGEKTIISVPVDSKFRLRVDALQVMLEQLKDDEYIACVIGVVGSTEEGAVDPIHKIKLIRDKLHQRNQSYWFHIDAAWGGYIRSLFCGHQFPKPGLKKDIEDINKNYIKIINAR